MAGGCFLFVSSTNKTDHHDITEILLKVTLNTKTHPNLSSTVSLFYTICIRIIIRIQHQGERAQNGWLGIRIMCEIDATCFPTDCCFSDLATKRVGQVQRGHHHHHHHLIEI